LATPLLYSLTFWCAVHLRRGAQKRVSARVCDTGWGSGGGRRRLEGRSIPPPVLACMALGLRARATRYDVKATHRENKGQTKKQRPVGGLGAAKERRALVHAPYRLRVRLAPCLRRSIRCARHGRGVSFAGGDRSWGTQGCTRRAWQGGGVWLMTVARLTIAEAPLGLDISTAGVVLARLEALLAVL
jgi:hypothetical protein